MDDLNSSEHVAKKLSKKTKKLSHPETVKMILANHARTQKVVRDRQDRVYYTDNGS